MDNITKLDNRWVDIQAGHTIAAGMMMPRTRTCHKKRTPQGTAALQTAGKAPEQPPVVLAAGALLRGFVGRSQIQGDQTITWQRAHFRYWVSGAAGRMG